MPTLAFFGATGDCAGFCLANALNAGYECRALARTPAKLSSSLKDKGVQPGAMDQYLTIIGGDVKDVEAVKKTLQTPNGKVVDEIICGIGGTPKLQWSIRRPVTLTDRTICQDAGNTILAALQELNSTVKPVLINVSTTGITPRGAPRDVPLLFVPLYYYFLAAPHEDKEVLQDKLEEHMHLPAEKRALAAYVNIKPSLLMDGESRGLANVREGVDENPAIGYTIRRIDIGSWIFENLVKQRVPRAWLNKGVTLTN